MQFIDFCYLTIKAGNGGDGALAWRREAHVSMGGPHGGNGGNGGDIIFVGDENVNNLFHLRKLKILKADNGVNGGNKCKNGSNAAHLYIKVPCGTVITDQKTGKKLFDIVYHNQEQLICKGGKGGYGNFHFKSNFNQAPTIYERGDLGEELSVKIEIHLIADVGFLGLPNAGKSTLLSKLSNAKPKVASYPFTTLQPVLGTVKFQEQKLVFADIPGIIEDAALGSGLGLSFLKHLSRCQVLVHLIDGSDPEQVINNYQIINNEIHAYSPELANKPQVVVLNKIDLGYYQQVHKQLENLIQKPVFIISGKNGTNLNQLLIHVFQLVNKIKIQQEENEVLEISDHHSSVVVDDIAQVTKTNHGFEVSHPKLAYWVHKLPQNTIGNQLRLRQKFITLKVDEQLQLAGAKEGDLIFCHGFSWYFMDKK